MVNLTDNDANSAILCYKSRLEVKNGTEKFDFAFKNFKKDEFYRMFVDKKKINNLLNAEN